MRQWTTFSQFNSVINVRALDFEFHAQVCPKWPYVRQSQGLLKADSFLKHSGKYFKDLEVEQQALSEVNGKSATTA